MARHGVSRAQVCPLSRRSRRAVDGTTIACVLYRRWRQHSRAAGRKARGQTLSQSARSLLRATRVRLLAFAIAVVVVGLTPGCSGQGKRILNVGNVDENVEGVVGGPTHGCYQFMDTHPARPASSEKPRLVWSCPALAKRSPYVQHQWNLGLPPPRYPASRHSFLRHGRLTWATLLRSRKGPACRRAPRPEAPFGRGV